MKLVHIKDKLKEIGMPVESLSLGDFDRIGEFTAKKARDENSELYQKVGCFFRPNYERGILIYSLIKKYHLSTYCEVGFGRGFSALCAAKAMHDLGNDGRVFTVDVKFDEKQMDLIKNVFPNDWLNHITAVQGPSQQALPELFKRQQTFDFVYIDGDHRADAVRSDWDALKDRWTSFCLFDDYHLPTKKEADIECAQVIDKVVENGSDDFSAELIRLDRRIFVDDRGFTDDQVDYGQCLLSKKTLVSTLNDW